MTSAFNAIPVSLHKDSAATVLISKLPVLLLLHMVVLELPLWLLCSLFILSLLLLRLLLKVVPFEAFYSLTSCLVHLSVLSFCKRFRLVRLTSTQPVLQLLLSSLTTPTSVSY